jgi:hypothetical protein
MALRDQKPCKLGSSLLQQCMQENATTKICDGHMEEADIPEMLCLVSD